MYKNVNAELARGDISVNDLAEVLNRTPNTVRLKLKGEYPLTVAEAKLIQTVINQLNNTYITLDELFKEAE